MIRGSHGGVGLQHITRKDLIELYLVIPDRKEQNRIVEILLDIDKKIETEIQYKQKLLAIKRGLMEDLLTGKVKVNHLIKEAGG